PHPFHPPSSEQITLCFDGPPKLDSAMGSHPYHRGHPSYENKYTPICSISAPEHTNSNGGKIYTAAATHAKQNLILQHCLHISIPLEALMRYPEIHFCPPLWS